MIEETLKFTDKKDGKDYKWEIDHNLDELNLKLDDFLFLFHKNFPQYLTDVNQFCMFVIVNAKAMKKESKVICVPKSAVKEMMLDHKMKNN